MIRERSMSHNGKKEKRVENEGGKEEMGVGGGNLVRREEENEVIFKGEGKKRGQEGDHI